MKIMSIRELAIPDILLIRFARFRDGRGYFTEPLRASDLRAAAPAAFADFTVVQTNESWSRAGVARGLHFQWNPYMGKLVRTLAGHMLDLVLDIRRSSPTLGSLLAVDMPARPDEEWDEWIWVPPGFAHGNLFLQDTRIEYLCSGEYSPASEAAVSLTSPDLEYRLVPPPLAAMLHNGLARARLSEKDSAAPSLGDWLADPRSGNFP